MNDLFTTRFGHRVSNQKHLDASDHPDRLPSQFTLHFPVQTRHVVRIVESQRRSFKADAVLALVDPVLSFIPCELQSRPL